MCECVCVCVCVRVVCVCMCVCVSGACGSWGVCVCMWCVRGVTAHNHAGLSSLPVTYYSMTRVQQWLHCLEEMNQSAHYGLAAYTPHGLCIPLSSLKSLCAESNSSAGMVKWQVNSMSCGGLASFSDPLARLIPRPLPGSFPGPCPAFHRLYCD